MAELSKLQIRAKVLSVVSQIKSSQENNAEFLKHLYSQLEDIDDTKLIIDILIKEYIKMEDNEAIFTGCLINEFHDIDYVQEKCFEYLKSSLYSDEIKIKLVHLMRIVGAKYNYEDTPQYFENPAEVIDTDTQKLLDKAAYNPEAMLDFLDFITAVPAPDKTMLLNSLKQDYSGDTLSNIVYPILYSDFDDKCKLNAIELLTEAKSALSIAPFKYLIETSSNDEVISACTLGLKKLKLAGATEEKAQDYFINIIKDTFPAVFYATIPDGNGNQAILISRIDDTGKYYILVAVVINDISGIVDSFGFYNISENELFKIIKRFYESDGKYKVTPEYIKMRINSAIKTTIKNKDIFPYEFICWAPFISDISPINEDVLFDFKQDKKEVTKNDILTALTKDYSFRWYIKPSENKALEKILDEIYQNEDVSVDFVNNLIKTNENNIFDKETLKIWTDRITQCVYMLNLNEKKADADIFYSILKNEEYFHTFRMVILQRSVINHFYSIKETEEESKLTTNIFRKKQIQKEKYDTKKAQEIVDILVKSWING